MLAMLLQSHWVERLKPTGKREEYRDDKAHGLILRLSPGGKKTWYCVYRPAGDRKQKRVLLGHFPKVTLEAARQAAQRVKLDAQQGTDLAESG